MERDYDKGLQNVWRKPGERAIESEREREREWQSRRERKCMRKGTRVCPGRK